MLQKEPISNNGTKEGVFMQVMHVQGKRVQKALEAGLKQPFLTLNQQSREGDIVCR